MKLKNNPFYILNLDCDASRAMINAAADERSLLDENAVVEQARSLLLSPNTRLAAEMDWFPGLKREQTTIIRKKIADDQPIDENSFNANIISQLNIKAHNMEFMQFRDIVDLQNELEIIDFAFSSADVKTILASLYTTNEKVSTPLISENSIIREMNRKRGDIRTIVSTKLTSLSFEDYILLVTRLAEGRAHPGKYGDDPKVKRGDIIDDIVDQYEIRVQHIIQSGANDVQDTIKALINSDDTKSIEEKSNKLVQSVSEWSILARPIQLKCYVSGMTHAVSRDLAHNLGQLIAALHNDKKETSVAAKLSHELYGIFAELPELADIFKEAENKLTSISNREIIDELMGEIETYKRYAESLISSSHIVQDASKTINWLNSLNERIRDSSHISSEEKNNLRSYICLITRDAAVNIHQKRGLTVQAYEIMYVVKTAFSDIPELSGKLMLSQNPKVARAIEKAIKKK